MKDKFFGSKLNSFLLLILIILMVIALFIMSKNKEVYLPNLTKGQDKNFIKNEINDLSDLEKNPLNTTVGYHICESKESTDCLLKEVYQKVLGTREDLVSFSIIPGQEVSGKNIIQGIISGGYFFEGNILINVLDSNKKIIKQSYANSTTEWMTDGPVEFQGEIDFSYLPKGNAFIEIHNDNASGLPENDKSILIPFIIK